MTLLTCENFWFRDLIGHNEVNKVAAYKCNLIRKFSKKMPLRFTNNLRLFVYFCLPNALVAELVDALDSKSSDFGRVGSIPTQGTS